MKDSTHPFSFLATVTDSLALGQISSRVPASYRRLGYFLLSEKRDGVDSSFFFIYYV